MGKNLDQNYVLIIGSSNMDLNIYIERFPKPGETVTGGIFDQFLGGKGANQAVASIRSGADTNFLGRVGMDAFGDQMIQRLTKEDINTSRMIKDPREKSGVAFILIDSQGENMISVAPGANKNLSVEDVEKNRDLIQNAGAIVVQMEIPLETIEVIFEIASQKSAIKILNPAPLKPFPARLLENIDIIIPNEGELMRLHSIFRLGDLPTDNKAAIVQASHQISELGVDTIITTLGARGCLVHDKETGLHSIKAFQVTAVDTVGAGDCFNGVLASKLCQGKDLITAVKYATAAASIAVTRKGAQDSIPYFDEIEKRFNEFTDSMEKSGVVT